MYPRTGLAAVAALSPLWIAPTVYGQAQTPAAPSADERMEQFERRLDEMDRRHREELRARDEEIARLKARLEGSPGAATPPAEAGRPAGTRPADTGPSDARNEEIDRTKEEILRDLDGKRTTPFPPATAPTTAPTTGRAPASFNPDLAVIADFVANYSPDRENDAYNRLDVREVELDLRAAVDPRADGVLVIAFERDVENPIFAGEEGDGEHEGGPETSVNLEEAYLFLHDFGVPNLTAKVGRFHVRFGRQNLLHLHDLPTTDPPFVSQAFLSPEALSDAGVSFSYVVPPGLVAGQYVELVGEILSGEGAGSESPTLGGDLSVDSPAFNGHVLWNGDVRRDLNLELGGSWLTGHADADNAHDVNLFGVDATLVRTDPSGRFRNFLLQGEAMWALVDGDGGVNNRAFGVYVLGQRQLNKDWYAGLRLDWTENPSDDDKEAWGVTPYVSWYWSEFLRFRASYQHRDGDRPAEDVVYLQVTWLFGAHRPHPYWSMR